MTTNVYNNPNWIFDYLIIDENFDDYKINKKRRYKLLLNTLNSYEKELNNISIWESKNIGKEHPDKRIVLNQIYNIKDKMNIIRNKF